MRRSTRVTRASIGTNRSVEDEEMLNEDSAGTQSPRNVDSNSVKSRKMSNKRKVEPQTTETNTNPPKRIRIMRGFLQAVTAMPLDVLVEIFVHLEPKDLLHLTWTAKDLRTLLLTKNANSSAMWRNAIANFVPHLPPCPEDMSEPRYVHLLFAEICHFCGRKSIGIFWELRMRTCRKCGQNEFNVKTVPEVLEPVCDLIPTGWQRPMFHQKTCTLWSEEYHQANDKDAWLESKRTERQKIIKHVRDCENWMHKCETLIEEAKNAILDSRKAIVMEHLKKLGWEEDISKLSSSDVHPLRLAEVQKACRHNITGKALSNLEPILNEYMKGLRNARRARTHHALIYKYRLPMLKSSYDTAVATFSVNSIYPGIVDVFMHSAIQEIICQDSTESEVKESDFKLESLFPEITARWKNRVEKCLLDMIPDDCVPNSTEKSASLFDLAIISFRCTECHHAALRYPEVMIHTCASATRYNSLKAENATLRIAEDKFLSVAWNKYDVIKFNKRAFRVVSEAIKMCGLDPVTTTASQMDELSPVFECTACNDEHHGRATMGWENLAMHWKKSAKHGSEEDTVPLMLFDESEASVVRARIVESKERARAKEDFKKMICIHCKQVGNAVDLVKHAKQEHGLSVATESDVALQMKWGRDSYLFRMWPPR